MKVCWLLENQALEHLGHQWTTLRCLKTALIYGKLIDNLKSRVHWWFFKDFYTFFHFFFRFLQISIVFVLFWFERPIKFFVLIWSANQKARRQLPSPVIAGERPIKSKEKGMPSRGEIEAWKSVERRFLR